MKYCLLISMLLLVLFSINVFAEDGWTYITEVNGQDIGSPLRMVSEDDGAIWMTFSNSVYKYDNNKWSKETAHFDSTAFRGYIEVTVSPNGNVWFAHHPSSLVRYDGENWHYYEHEDASISFSCIGVDAEENVWCGSNDGLYKFDGYVWKKYTTQNGLESNSVSRIGVSATGEIWVRYNYPYVMDKPVSVFSQYKGISRFNGMHWETFNTENGLNSNKVDDIAFDPDGLTYISYGTWGPRGIMRFDGATWETITETVGGELDFDQNGILWISDTDNTSLYKYDGTEITRFPDKPQEIPRYAGNKVFDSNGNVWFAVLGGILIYDLKTGIMNTDKQEPKSFVLLNNYPNPFNATTNILFYVPKSSDTNLTIYNSSGQVIIELVNNYMQQGYHSIVFNGENLPSGLYFIRLQSGKIVKSERIMLIK